MPLVFVHGVNNRPNASWEKGKAIRHSYFRRFLYPRLKIDPTAVRFLDPMWGPYGSSFAWDNASLPSFGGNVEQLGGADRDVLELLSEGTPQLGPVHNDAIAQIAKKSLVAAVDVLWAEGARVTADPQLDAWAEAGRKATEYARQPVLRPWVSQVTTDAEFIRKLQTEIEAEGRPPASDRTVGRAETLGPAELWLKVVEAADRVSHALEATTTAVVFAVGRERVHRDFGLGLGDVLIYLAERGTRAKPGRIIQEVAGALDEASTSRTAEDPTLILVGHSLGGIIAYDLLSYYRPKIKVDVFASVGSQIGLLEEIKVLKASDKTIGQDRDTKVVPRLKNIGRWINVYDLNDPASFSTSKIFSDSTDYLYTTGLAPRPAHSGYWIRPSFYERLADRVSQP